MRVKRSVKTSVCPRGLQARAARRTKSERAKASERWPSEVVDDASGSERMRTEETTELLIIDRPGAYPAIATREPDLAKTRELVLVLGPPLSYHPPSLWAILGGECAPRARL